MAEFGKIVVFATGLIGGSFALALKEAEAVEEGVGFGRTPSTLRIARELGVIDRAGINPTHEIEDADIVLVFEDGPVAFGEDDGGNQGLAIG